MRHVKVSIHNQSNNLLYVSARKLNLPVVYEIEVSKKSVLTLDPGLYEIKVFYTDSNVDVHMNLDPVLKISEYRLPEDNKFLGRSIEVELKDQAVKINCKALLSVASILQSEVLDYKYR